MSDFIGTQFETSKGSIITVVGICKNRANGAKVYQVECSVCSKDKEMYPFPFVMMKGNLKGGSTPCGCAKSPKFTPAQMQIRLSRLCQQYGLTFVKFNEPYKKLENYFTFNCPHHGDQVNRVYNFIYNHTRCQKCNKDNRATPTNNSVKPLSLTELPERKKKLSYSSVFSMMKNKS